MDGLEKTAINPINARLPHGETFITITLLSATTVTRIFLNHNHSDFGVWTFHGTYFLGNTRYNMRPILLFSLMLNLLSLSSTNAQSTSATQSYSAVATTTTATTFVSLTPAMSSSSVASYFSSLATSAPQQPGSGPSAGDAGSASGSGSADSDAGASGGGSSGTIELSKGGLIAIIVVIVVVVVFGIASSILYWLAKKRSWEVRKTIRRSAKRVATALTPRRTTFPKDVRSSRGLTRIDEVPPTPRKSSLTDIEKGNSKMGSFEMKEPPKHSKWGRKLGR